jgi:hypothetical protein
MIGVHRKILFFSIAIFSLLAALYVGRGLQQLVIISEGAKDLRTNWDELRLVLHHANPYDVADTASPYPPFTYPANLALLWPPWPVVRWYFALVSLGCLGFVARWAYRVAAWHDNWLASTLAMSILATSAISTGLGLGQNAILYTALLVLALQLRERGWNGSSGFVLGITLSKISLAMPFLLPFFFRRDWRVLIAAGMYVVGATAVVCIWLNASPVELIQQWIQRAEKFACVDYGPASLICHLGFPANTVNRICEATVIAGATAIFARLRGLSLVTLFGLAAGIGRLWTYHRLYDNFVLVILLVAIGDAYLRRKQWQLGVAMLAVGSTLWLPPKMAEIEIIQVLHVTLWGAATIALAIWAPPAQEPTGDSPLAENATSSFNYVARKACVSRRCGRARAQGKR